jgi:hypothetical protein
VGARQSLPTSAGDRTFLPAELRNRRELKSLFNRNLNKNESSKGSPESETFGDECASYIARVLRRMCEFLFGEASNGNDRSFLADGR